MADFPVYVISLDADRYERTAALLRAHGLVPERVPGVDPETARGDSRISPLCRLICTDKTAAVGLAHVRLAEIFLQTGHKMCLVCEDDARIRSRACPALVEIARQAGEGWDIIRLIRQGVRRANCGPPVPTTAGSGSAAAYLLSRTGATKTIAMPILYHIDIMHNSSYFRTLNGPDLFSTFDQEEGPCIAGQTTGYFLRQHAFRIGNVTVRFFEFLFLVAAVVATYLSSWDSNLGLAMRHCCLAALGFCVGFATFVTCDQGFYRTSAVTLAFGLLFPLLVLVVCKPHGRMSALLILGAYSMLFFNICFASHGMQPGRVPGNRKEEVFEET